MDEIYALNDEMARVEWGHSPVQLGMRHGLAVLSQQLLTVDRTLRLPADNLFSLDDLLTEDVDTRLARLPSTA